MFKPDNLSLILPAKALSATAKLVLLVFFLFLFLKTF